MNVTIHNLEVRFEIEGEGDAAVFARMFQEHMRRWQDIVSQRERHAKRIAAESTIVAGLNEDDA